MIYNPITHELFSTTEGKPSMYTNFKTAEKHKMQVTPGTDFKQMIVLYNSNMDVPKAYDIYKQIYEKLFDSFRISPILFSSDLDMTKVADGLAGAVISPRTAPYDHISSLIVENAGGLVFAPDGSEFDPMRRGIIAVNHKKTFDRLEDLGIIDLCKEINRISPR